MRGRSIPNYELYGELLSGSYTDPVHHETIRERSSQHSWTIRLHRHSRLAQVFLFRSSGVSIQLADITHASTEPLIMFVPPGVPHGFRFEEDVGGDVLSLRINELGQDFGNLLGQQALQAGAILPRSSSASFDQLDALFVQLGEVYHGVQIERSELLHALTRLIVTYIFADLRNETAVGSVRQSVQLTHHEQQAEAFCGLVEKRFNQNCAVSDYAKEIGVSAPHLTRVCKNVLGSTPNELVRQRRLLEAKRLLEYTRLSVSDISHRSGFRDPSFFSRTFSKTFGKSPISYRKEKDL